MLKSAHGLGQYRNAVTVHTRTVNIRFLLLLTMRAVNIVWGHTVRVSVFSARTDT